MPEGFGNAIKNAELADETAKIDAGSQLKRNKAAKMSGTLYCAATPRLHSRSTPKAISLHSVVFSQRKGGSSKERNFLECKLSRLFLRRSRAARPISKCWATAIS